MLDELTGNVQALIMPYIDEMSAELVELTIKHRGKTVVIDVLADRPGGITIDECAFINKKIDHALERKNWFGEDYTVEVSSPGLDRPLKTSKDFSRAFGRKIRVHLTHPIEGKLEHQGEICKALDDKILIKTKEQTITIPLEAITKAVQVIE